MSHEAEATRAAIREALGVTMPEPSVLDKLDAAMGRLYASLCAEMRGEVRYATVAEWAAGKAAAGKTTGDTFTVPHYEWPEAEIATLGMCGARVRIVDDAGSFCVVTIRGNVRVERGPAPDLSTPEALAQMHTWHRKQCDELAEYEASRAPWSAR